MYDHQDAIASTRSLGREVGRTLADHPFGLNRNRLFNAAWHIASFLEVASNNDVYSLSRHLIPMTSPWGGHVVYRTTRTLVWVARPGECRGQWSSSRLSDHASTIFESWEPRGQGN